MAICRGLRLTVRSLGGARDGCDEQPPHANTQRNSSYPPATSTPHRHSATGMASAATPRRLAAATRAGAQRGQCAISLVIMTVIVASMCNVLVLCPDYPTKILIFDDGMRA